MRTHCTECNISAIYTIDRNYKVALSVGVNRIRVEFFIEGQGSSSTQIGVSFVTADRCGDVLFFIFS